MDTSKQPSFNLGIVGHVDHGKTTLTKLLSGKWTDTHSEEAKKGITIKLGYTNFSIYKSSKDNSYSIKKDVGELVRQVSIVDAPGHESFMATMISGSAIMDYALLLVAANEECPQPQTYEHLKMLEIAGIKKVIVIQNKVDLVTREEAIENFKQIENFLKDTIYSDSKIVPMSAEYGANLTKLLETIDTYFDEPVHNREDTAQMFIVRSFDVNKPGQDYSQLRGGVLGGALRQGSLKVGDEIEIRPGLFKNQNQKMVATPIKATIEGLKSDKYSLDEAFPGGSVAIMTQLDPYLTRSDKLVGQVAGRPGTLPEPLTQITFEPHLFDKIHSLSKSYEIKPIHQSEPLMLILNSSTTIGVVSATKGQSSVTMTLKKPVMGFENDRVVIFRQVEPRKWKIIGYGLLKL
ncbi:MAG: translation initiation factor IF-2 subunit gamma [Candidatus Nanoarchaeia archaeon]